MVQNPQSKCSFKSRRKNPKIFSGVVDEMFVDVPRKLSGPEKLLVLRLKVQQRILGILGFIAIKTKNILDFP